MRTRNLLLMRSGDALYCTIIAFYMQGPVLIALAWAMLYVVILVIR